MLGLLGINKMVLIGGAVLILGLAGAIYVQKKWHDSEIAKKEQVINELNGKLIAEKIQRETLERNLRFMQDSVEIQREEREILQDKFRNADSERRRLQKIFDNHDLEKLSREKPNLIQGIINRGTKKTFDDFEKITE